MSECPSSALGDNCRCDTRTPPAHNHTPIAHPLPGLQVETESGRAASRSCDRCDDHTPHLHTCDDCNGWPNSYIAVATDGTARAASCWPCKGTGYRHAGTPPELG
jgi:hypothetical protein